MLIGSQLLNTRPPLVYYKSLFFKLFLVIQARYFLLIFFIKTQ